VISAARGSLQLRLVLRLAILYVVTTALVLGILVYRAYETAGTLNDRELSLRAADLAKHVSVDASGAAHLDLPPRLRAEYESGRGADIFAIRRPGSAIVAASPPAFGQIVARWPNPTDDPSYFRLNSVGESGEDYYGLSIELPSVAGPVSISVARAAGANALIQSLLREFVLDVAWLIPLLFLVTLAIGAVAIRRGLEPIRKVSELAAAIGPNATSIRLPEEHLPSEIIPLVAAVNPALDRLEQGFLVQRQFTANAAHQLRTPLAIVTAALDTMPGNGELRALKADVARMNRLVEQLLRVARLDTVPLNVSGAVDLNETAAKVVASLAPWALAQERTLAFVEGHAPVEVQGNSHAIADAIRNLIENAVVYSPPHSEIVVRSDREGRVSVADRGPGIAAADREHVFERFGEVKAHIRMAPGSAWPLYQKL
jgi:signal transduction histidine kinase